MRGAGQGLGTCLAKVFTQLEEWGTGGVPHRDRFVISIG